MLVLKFLFVRHSYFYHIYCIKTFDIFKFLFFLVEMVIRYGNRIDSCDIHASHCYSSILSILILLLKKRELDEGHIFLYSCCKSFQIHINGLVSCFERIDHYTHLDFSIDVLDFSYSFSILFLSTYDQRL